MKIEKLMIDGKVVKYTEYGTLVYHDDFTERVKQLLEVMTPKEVEAIYATHDFEEDSFYEIEPGIYLFGTVEEEEVVDMELKSVDYSNAALGPWGPEAFNFPSCNITSNKQKPYIHPNNKWRGSLRIIRTWTFESNRRFKAKVWSTNYRTHATGGFHTRLQRRRLRVWWASRADKISVSVRGNVYFPYLGSDDKLKGLYIPIKLDPWLYNRGLISRPNESKASVNFGLVTAQVGLTNNLNTLIATGLFCDPNENFNSNTGQIINGENKYCKPKWKAAKNVKIKDSESCHYVEKGSFTGEMQIKVKFND